MSFVDKSADAVVIGAGISGASIAFNLLKQGLKKVVILEKYLIASCGIRNAHPVLTKPELPPTISSKLWNI